MLNVIGIEGVSRAGKTTFAKRLETDTLKFVWETESVLDNVDLTLDKFQIRQRFAELEIAKKAKLGALDQNLILDRTYFSTLAFSYAKGVATGDWSEHDFDVNFFRQNKDKIIIPEKIFFFDVPPEESIRRRMEASDRDPTHPYWTDPVFLKAFSDYFRSDEFFEFYPKDDIHFIDTHTLDPETTYHRLRETIVKTFNLEPGEEKDQETRNKFMK
jgi:thymidylate kinase